MMRCINALSSALFAPNDPKTPLPNGEQGTEEECQYVKNVPISHMQNAKIQELTTKREELEK